MKNDKVLFSVFFHKQIIFSHKSKVDCVKKFLNLKCCRFFDLMHFRLHPVPSVGFLSVDSFSSTLLGRPFDVKYFPILTCGQNFLFSISQIKAFGSLWSLLHPGAKPRGQHIACMLPACSKHVACMLPACY